MFTRRLFSVLKSSVRGFAETPAPVEPAAAPAKVPVAEPKSKSFLDSLDALMESQLPAAEMFTIDPTTLPNTTMRRFDFRMQKRLYQYLNELRQVITDGDLGFFEQIEVQSFGEFTPLPMSAQVKYQGNNEYRVEVFDVANAPLIELELKRSHFNFEVTRDFSVITAKYTPNPQADREKLKKLEEQAISDINAVKEEAITLVSPKNKNAPKLFDNIASRFIEQVKHYGSVKAKKLK